MINTLKNIEFSYGSLTFLNEQTEQVQNTILGAIFKAVVSDLSILEHKRLGFIVQKDVFLVFVC